MYQKLQKKRDFINGKFPNANNLAEIGNPENKGTKVEGISTLANAQDPLFSSWKEEIKSKLKSQGVNELTIDAMFSHLNDYTKAHNEQSQILSQSLYVKDGNIVVEIDSVNKKFLFVNKVLPPVVTKPQMNRPDKLSGMKEDQIRAELKDADTATERRQDLINELMQRYYQANKNIPREERKRLDLANLNLSGVKNLQNFNKEGEFLLGAFGVDFSNSNLSGAFLEGANLTNANLTGTNLAGANLQGAKLVKAKMAGVILRDANLKEADLTNADFSVKPSKEQSNFILPVTDIRSADFTDAKMDGVRLAPLNNPDSALLASSTDVDYLRADGANFTNASLNGASNLVYLSGNFTGANFEGAKMNKTFLSGLFVGSSFKDASLVHSTIGAILWDSDLRGADFTGADLKTFASGRSKNGEGNRKSAFDGAKYNETTKLDKIKFNYFESGVSTPQVFDPQKMGMSQAD